MNNRCWLVYASSIGKHRVKKRTYLRGRFCFHFPKNMAQNNKYLWSLRHLKPQELCHRSKLLYQCLWIETFQISIIFILSVPKKHHCKLKKNLKNFCFNDYWWFAVSFVKWRQMRIVRNFSYNKESDFFVTLLNYHFLIFFVVVLSSSSTYVK